MNISSFYPKKKKKIAKKKCAVNSQKKIEAYTSAKNVR